MVLNRNPDALSPFPGSVVHCESLINPRRETVMVLLHEASRSGAPILGWNIINELKIDHNVVAVVLKTGPIIAAIQSAANETVNAEHRSLRLFTSSLLTDQTPTH